MRLPLITFAVCAYNEEKTIASCIEHILKLDYPRKEIIVGSDGTDRTATIARRYPIKVITAKKRIGKTNMLLRILDQAKGEIVLVNDAEFFFFPKNGLYDLVKYFKDSKVGAVSFGSVGPVEHEYHRSWWTLVEVIIQNLFRYYRIKKNPITSLKDANFLVIANAFRRKIISELQTINDDAEIAYHVLSKGYKVVYVPEVAFYGIGGTATTLSDQIKQRSRTSIGWMQIGKIYKIKLGKFYFQMILLWSKLIASLVIWVVIFAYGLIKGKILYLLGRRAPEKIWKKIKR